MAAKRIWEAYRVETDLGRLYSCLYACSPRIHVGKTWHPVKGKVGKMEEVEEEGPVALADITTSDKGVEKIQTYQLRPQPAPKQARGQESRGVIEVWGRSRRPALPLPPPPLTGGSLKATARLASPTNPVANPEANHLQDSE